MKVFSNLSVEIKEEELVVMLGGEPENPGNASKFVKEHLEIVEEGKQLIQPKAIIDDFEVQKVIDRRLYLENEVFFESELFSHFTPGAKSATLCIATIGSELETREHQYMKQHEYIKGAILDSLGNLALQKAELEITGHVKEKAREQGLNSSVPLSPGQVGWDVADQQIFFKRLDAEKIGVKLSSSNLMIPKKSASMLIGMGENVIGEGKACDYCHLRATCISRKFKDYSNKKQSI